MLDLDEMQFEILRGEDSSEGVGFGIGLDVAVNDGGFDPGELSWMTQDSANPIRGTTMFGRDVATGRNWRWSMHVDQEDEVTALAALGRLATAWRGRDYVSKPGALTALRYHIAGRTRRVYGRPRRFAAPPTNLILSGMVPVTADFSLVDDLHYDDTLSSQVLTWSADSDGGFVLPATLPIVTMPSSNRQGAVYVDGDAATYPIIRFDGPITKPYLAADDWVVSLDISLGANEYAEVDTRPWKLTALKNGSVNVSGSLGRRQWLSDVKLYPGPYSLVFGGASSSGGGQCTVSWRSAWNSL